MSKVPALSCVEGACPELCRRVALAHASTRLPTPSGRGLRSTGVVDADGEVGPNGVSAPGAEKFDMVSHIGGRLECHDLEQSTHLFTDRVMLLARKHHARMGLALGDIL